MVGGLWGRMIYGSLSVYLLFIPEALRGQGWGTALMQRAEAEPVAQGCRGVLLDTFSFQARPFYERLGFHVYATIEDYPTGHSFFSMQKRLNAAAQPSS